LKFDVLSWLRFLLLKESVSLSVRTSCRSLTCQAPGPLSLNFWVSVPPGEMMFANTGYSVPR
jgi:hypothetical protein